MYFHETEANRRRQEVYAKQHIKESTEKTIKERAMERLKESAHKRDYYYGKWSQDNPHTIKNLVYGFPNFERDWNEYRKQQ